VSKGGTMNKYAWKQLSQWDVIRNEYFTQSKKVETGLSSATCTYLLVEQIDKGGGYIRIVPIRKDDVTADMLEIAGSI